MTLVCYLDDSGTDGANPFVTLAGYVGTVESWAAFETDAKAVLDKFQISRLRGKDLYHTNGEYKGWRIDKKLDLVTRLNEVLAPRVGLAVSFATHKREFNNKLGSVLPQESSFGFCFEGVLDRLLKDKGFIDAAWSPGMVINFYIENGNANNEEIYQRYKVIKMLNDEFRFLGEMQFVKKGSSIAIQMADLFEFFSRRQAVAAERSWPRPVEHDRYLTALRKDIRDIGFAAIDFGSQD